MTPPTFTTVGADLHRPGMSPDGHQFGAARRPGRVRPRQPRRRRRAARPRGRLRAAYAEFRGGTRWGHFDAASLITAFGRYIDLNEMDARWVAQIAAAFRAAGGDGALGRLPDAAIEASLRAAGLGGGRESVTFDSPVAFGFPPTSGYADDPVNTASGNFLIAETDCRSGRWRPG